MIDDAYKHKIKTAAEIAAIIGAPGRKKKIVMCHGTFDLVHPGHIRHLVYARSKGAKLIVGVTADHHVKKADHRPFVPEGLRALNLAALETVDYVTIDPHATPIENILTIKPDYFVKGYEYQKGGLHPRTAEEKQAVESYGGEVIFTPGDIVYSSSAIIESGPPDLAVEKLINLLDGENRTFDDLKKALAGLSGAKAHVVGDTIVDSLTVTSMIGASGKTPTLSVRYEGKRDYVGGAGIVAKHLKAAGADVTFSTVLGDDALAEFVRNDLAEAGVTLNDVVDLTRPTINKNAIVADGYRMLKIDTLDNRAISEQICKQLCRSIRDVPADAVMFCDFRHGIFNGESIPLLTAAIPEGRFKVADSQVASRWGNILQFKGFDLITPNEKEARFSLGDQDTVIRPLGTRLYEEALCKVLILKLGARGSMTFRQAGGELRTFFGVDSFADHVVDAVGSGDALLAYATLALKTTGDEVIATILGAMAAAAECELDGNIPVEPAMVMKKIETYERRANFSA
ncbi:PfkB family carbohydrate kinase [Thalassobaculum sp.]|uniref:PfkB family carbohydrate kinase n=1 Tax=Thalassobaculum sp. TaxID=2022740 RepID=UPI0032F02E54